MALKTVAVLGSTGSIGTQALEVIDRHRDRFEVVALAAGGNRLELLAQQVLAFNPQHVAVPTPSAAAALERALSTENAERRRHNGSARHRLPEIWVGPNASERIAAQGAEVVLNALAGAAGLRPTLAALRAGSTLALANKESLVIGGALVQSQLQRPDQIVPVDSEHSALAQCLRAGQRAEVDRLILTASGGPFRGRTREQLKRVTPAEALQHPTWAMGPLVTVNSSTLFNKALELIEAHLLFSFPPERIDVVVHPQSQVHSMVQFRDGAVIAQVSPPDMRLPIALALAWPERLNGVIPSNNWNAATQWHFEPLDESVFPAVQMARQALTASPLHPAVFNGANEACVEAFLDGRLSYLGITDTVAAVLQRFTSSVLPGTVPSLEQVMAADAWGRTQAEVEGNP